MNTEKFDYYMLESSGAYTSPLLDVDGRVDWNGIDFIRKGIRVPDDTVTHLAICTPKPRKPAMVDYLDLTISDVFSKKIYDALQPLNISGIQLIAAVIRGIKDEQYTDYWVLNALNRYSVLDKDKSVYTSIDRYGEWNCIERISLDKDLVSKIPLEERLIFASKESSGFYILYHKSIVDIIMSVEPKGLVFVPVDKWFLGICYKG